MSTPTIITNSEILGGKPIIAGTRIAVSTILDLLATGMNTKEILAEYPTLTEEAITSAITFASSRVNSEISYPIIEKDGSLIFPSL